MPSRGVVSKPKEERTPFQDPISVVSLPLSEQHTEGRTAGCLAGHFGCGHDNTKVLHTSLHDMSSKAVLY